VSLLNLNLVFRLFARRWRVSAVNNRLVGPSLTVYLDRKPVFNLVADKGKEGASDYPYRHNWLWGNLRWQVGS
jgi:hypothetical protein